MNRAHMDAAGVAAVTAAAAALVAARHILDKGLPCAPKHVMHKHGGQIERIDSIGHLVGKPVGNRSTDYWFVTGRVKWSDGTFRDNVQIDPTSMCYEDDAGRAEIHAVSGAIMDYLLVNGEFREDGSWFATKRST